MNIAPVSFAGKAELSRFTKEFAPLTQEENKIAKMASKFYDTDVDITSDGVYITSEDADFRNSFIEALKSQSLYKSTFAYNVALDAAKAPANEALLYGDEQFREVARNIAKNNPYITKEMVLADFDKLK